MKTRIIAPVFLLMLVAAVAFGQDAGPVTETAVATAATPDNAITQLASTVLSILEPVLLLLATWLTAKAGTWFHKKTKIEIPAAVEAKIDDWIEQGIHLASEKAHKTVKEKTTTLTGPEKLEIAADFVLKMAKAQGWDTWAKETLEAKIESKLGKSRQ